MLSLALVVALAGAKASAVPFPPDAPEAPSVRLFSYAYKAVQAAADSSVEVGLRIVARAPLAFGDSVPFVVCAETSIISQTPEPAGPPDLSLVKAVDVLLSAEHRVGEFRGAQTSLVLLGGFSSALPGEDAKERTLRRYGAGVRVSHPASGASGRLAWGRDEAVGVKGYGQFMFDGVVPLLSDGSIIGGLSASLAVGPDGRDRVLVWLGTDPVALVKRLKK